MSSIFITDVFKDFSRCLDRAISEHQLFGCGIKDFRKPYDVGVYDICAAFLQIPVCCKGYVESVCKILLRQFSGSSGVSDIFLNRRIVHSFSVVWRKFIPSFSAL